MPGNILFVAGDFLLALHFLQAEDRIGAVLINLAGIVQR
jgi:hypothetical protein